MMKFKLLLILPIILSLSGCSLFSPVKTDPEKTYLLNVVPCPATKKPQKKITLLVAQPEANVLFNSSTMAYSKGPHQISYFSKSSWAATPAQMLQPLMVQTLQETGYFQAVLTNAASGRIDYVLNTQLIKLEQDFLCNYSDVILKLNAQIINATTNEIVAAKSFCYVVPAPCDTPYGGVIAANEATACVLKQLANFVLKAT